MPFPRSDFVGSMAGIPLTRPIELEPRIRALSRSESYTCGSPESGSTAPVMRVTPRAFHTHAVSLEDIAGRLVQPAACGVHSASDLGAISTR